jgi:hypothetical protein
MFLKIFMLWVTGYELRVLIRNLNLNYPVTPNS